MTDHFRRKSLFFQDTRDHPKHDAKNRLSSPSPGPEKPLAEIDRLKENRPEDSDKSFLGTIREHDLPENWDE